MLCGLSDPFVRVALGPDATCTECRSRLRMGRWNDGEALAATG
jgi:hypothetical protein